MSIEMWMLIIFGPIMLVLLALALYHNHMGTRPISDKENE